MKTRSEQNAAAKPSPKAASIGLMRNLADRLNLLRGTAADQTTRKLRLAGFLSRDATVVFVFLKLALPLTLGFLMIFLTSVTGIIEVSDDLVLPVCIGAVLAGFVLPEAYVKNVATKRREILNYLLPEGLDLLTICVEAGLSIDAAFRRVSREMQTAMPELASEFEITAIELTYLPDRQQALENMTERSDSPAVAALVNALRQTEKYGTPLAASLRILSQEFRQTRASKAEEKGARMPALMTVPLMVFILPTLITVLIAPAIMSAFALT
jgi:tight adherence protein C